jgi:Bacteriophage minor capsid protein
VILEALGDYIQSHSLGTLGVNLFLSKMPPLTPDYCVTLYEYEGQAPLESFGSAPYDIDMPRVQVRVRAPLNDYPTARDSLQAIRVLLSGITEQTISSTRILRVASVGSVMPLGLDEKDRPMLVANFQVYVAR